MAKDVSSGDTKVEEKKPVKKKEKNIVQTKLVIRCLPPGLKEEELLQVIGPLPPHDYFRFANGDKTLAPQNFCRAYINLTSPEDILSFRDKVDGLELVDSKGNSQQCVVEYAPFQKNPRKTKKREDNKVGTIEEDPDYKAFLETLQAEEEKTVIDLEKFLEELEKKEQKHKYVETPLTAFLKEKRDERKRIRDERRRVEQERRKKRDEERKRRDVERKKKLDAEKNRKKKEDDRKSRRDDDDDGSDSKSHDKKYPEAQGKGDGKGLNKYKGPRFMKDLKKTSLVDGVFSNIDLEKNWITQNKINQIVSQEVKLQRERESIIQALLGKFEASAKSGPRLSDTKPKKSEPIRRGPIGSKPKELVTENNDKERPYKDTRGSYERGGYSGSRPSSRGRGYRPSSREFPPRKWDKSDDSTPPRSRNKSWTDDQDRKSDKVKSKRPDREIYRPGSSRSSATRPTNSEGQSSSRPHKYSEQRNKTKQEEEK